MTPAQLAALTPEEREAWEECEARPGHLTRALETIATLRADLATEQARHTRAWKALCVIGEALDKAGCPTLIPERALRVGEAVEALIAERDGLRAELARVTQERDYYASISEKP